MPRIRSIHYDALKSEKLAAASAEAERLYWRMATHCDDDGRAEDDPRIFAAYLFPLDDAITGAVVDGWLAELDRLGLIIRYEIAGRRYVQVTRWKDYQKPNKPTPSKYPPPTGHGAEDYGSATGGLPLGEGVGVGEGESARKRAAQPTEATYEISDRMREWAAANVPGVDVDAERLRWLDWCAAGGKTFKSFDAAFRTWLGRARQYGAAPTTVKPSTYGTPTRALLGRGVDAKPVFEINDEGFAVPVREAG